MCVFDCLPVCKCVSFLLGSWACTHPLTQTSHHYCQDAAKLRGNDEAAVSLLAKVKAAVHHVDTSMTEADILTAIDNGAVAVAAAAAACAVVR